MKNDVFWTRVIYIISIVVSLLVAFLILGPRPQGIEGTLDVSFLPFVNATLTSRCPQKRNAYLLWDLNAFFG